MTIMREDVDLGAHNSSVASLRTAIVSAEICAAAEAIRFAANAYLLSE